MRFKKLRYLILAVGEKNHYFSWLENKLWHIKNVGKGCFWIFSKKTKKEEEDKEGEEERKYFDMKWCLE